MAMTHRRPFTAAEKQQIAAALALLDGGRNWTQGSSARTATGAKVRAQASDADAWCLVGALVHVGGQLSLELSCQLWLRLGQSPSQWNDVQESFGPVAAFLRSCLEEK